MRKPWLLNLLLLAALAVAGLRRSSSGREPLPGLPAPAASPAPPAASSEVEVEPAAEQKPERFDVIVAKDLFSAARGVVAPAAPKPGEVKPAPKPVPVPKITLSGVVILDGQKAAFVQEGAQETRPRKVVEGDTFAGGKVTAIRPDGISILFPSGEVAVPLRTPKETAGGPVPAPMPGIQNLPVPGTIPGRFGGTGGSNVIPPRPGQMPQPPVPPGAAGQPPGGPPNANPLFVPEPEEPQPGEEEIYPEEDQGLDQGQDEGVDQGDEGDGDMPPEDQPPDGE